MFVTFRVIFSSFPDLPYTLHHSFKKYIPTAIFSPTNLGPIQFTLYSTGTIVPIALRIARPLLRDWIAPLTEP